MQKASGDSIKRSQSKLLLQFLKGSKLLFVLSIFCSAMMTLIDMIGDVEVVAQMAVLAEGSAADRDDIVFLEKLPLFDAQGNPL